MATLDAVTFDGTNDYATYSDTIGTDSNKFTFCFSAKRSAQTHDCTITNCLNSRFRLEFESGGANDNLLDIQGKSSSDVELIKLYSNTPHLVADGWVHWVGSFDLSDSNKRHLYRNGVSDIGTINEYTDGTIDFTRGVNGYCANTNSNRKFAGDITMVALWTTKYIDLSDPNNLQLFYKNNAVVNLGYNASAVGLGTPDIYFPNGDPTDNRGSAGNYTLYGAIASATGPTEGYFNTSSSNWAIPTYNWDNP